MITVYSKPKCPYCTRAKQLLRDKGIEYTEVIVGVGITRDELYDLCGNPESLTVPQIFIADHRVGGFDDLVAYFERQEVRNV